MSSIKYQRLRQAGRQAAAVQRRNTHSLNKVLIEAFLDSCGLLLLHLSSNFFKRRLDPLSPFFGSHILSQVIFFDTMQSQKLTYNSLQELDGGGL